MGIAMLAATRLVQVVPVWVDGLRPRMAANQPHRRFGAQRARTEHEQGHAGWHGMAKLADDLLDRLVSRRSPVVAPLHGPGPAHPRTLRVLRVLEPQQPRAAAGRMVISGRMADVCAELDRLAAAEAAMHQ